MENQKDSRQGTNEIAVDASPEMRRGVFANLVMAATLPTGMVQLNFVDVDRPADGDTASGILAARVYLTPQDVMALRDMLIKHTESWKVETDGAQAYEAHNSIDPFDVAWSTTDPLGREVTMLKSVARAREALGKHLVPPEFLSTDDVKIVIEDPMRIDESVSSSTREIYYREEPEEEYRYSRAVVDFKNGSEHGLVISWSRYQKTVSSYGVIWKKDEEGK